MLQFLKIRNLALIDSLSLEFEKGFTAFTGETGAGKSIILGALAFLGGSRADKAIIKQDADICEVEASLFLEEDSSVNLFLEERGLPVCDDHQLLLHRSLSRTKGSRIQINGSLSTVSVLQELGHFWIDIHGPSEPQKLFSEKTQLEVVDSFAKVQELKNILLKKYGEWKSILSEIEELIHAEKLTDDALEFFRQQLTKLGELDISESSIEALEQDFKNISYGQELLHLSSQLTNVLSGDAGVSSQLADLRKAVQRLSEIDSSKEALLNRFDALIIEFEDLSEDFSKIAQSCDYDEAQIADIQNKMSIWCELKRQYGSEISGILKKKEELSRKIDLQSGIEDKLLELRDKAQSKEADLLKDATVLHKKRELISKVLAEEVQKMLLFLGFKLAIFRINLGQTASISETGNTALSFDFSPNAGASPLPLNKIASSGELARVMLAIKTVLAQVDQTPLLVFDEVDANVGGEIGAIVGRELAKLSSNHQVFCVTHLPQVAAQAQNHFCVVKEQSENSTRVSISSLHDKDRLSELARMLGDRNSVSAINHAQELLAKG